VTKATAPISEQKTPVVSPALNCDELRVLLDAMPVGAGWFDREGRCLLVNSAFVDLFEYSVNDVSDIEQWLLHVCNGIVPRETISGWYAQQKSTQNCNTTQLPLQLEINCKNGAVKEVILAARPVLSHMFVTCTDVTELEQLKREQRENEERFSLTLAANRDAVLERENAEKESRDASQLLQQTFASLNEAVFIVQSGTRIIQNVNSAVEKMFGYSRDEIIGNHTSCLHLDEQMFLRFGSEMTQAYDEKGYYETTYRMMRKDGTVFDSEHCVTPIRDNNGDITSHVCVVRDITERMRAEMQLHKLNQERGVILDNVSVGIALTKNRDFVWANNRFEEMFGFSKDELTGQSVRLLYPSDEVFEQAGRDAYGTVSKGLLYVSELELRHKDGSLFWAKYYGTAIDPDNLPAGTIWIAENIEARKQAEQALDEKTRLLNELNENLETRVERAVEELRQKDDILTNLNRLLVDLAPEAIIVFDIRMNRIVDANGKAEKLFDCSRNVLLRSSPLKFYHHRQPDGRPPEASFIENVTKVLAGNVLTIERAIMGSKGQEILCEVRLVRLPSPHGDLVRASFFDITERVHAQKELTKALASEHRMNDEQRQFMGLVSHELRTPLAIIDGTAQLLALTACKDKDCLMHAERILGATRRLSSMIDTCLTEERLCTSGWVPVMVPVDISQLVKNAIGLAQSETGQHQIGSDLERLPEQYCCDPMLVKVLLNNLLDNAIKYSPDGGNITVRGWRVNAAELCLEVADQGIGIAPDQMDKVFERFHRIGQLPKIAGAGLGLHIVKRVAELHAGSVSCISTTGRGSTFTVRLCSET
jgi:PAS domain S-box-containing protein